MDSSLLHPLRSAHTEQIKAVVEECGHKNIVSILEGGYSLSSLARSVVAHIKTLADL